MLQHVCRKYLVWNTVICYCVSNAHKNKGILQWHIAAIFYYSHMSSFCFSNSLLFLNFKCKIKLFVKKYLVKSVVEKKWCCTEKNMKYLNNAKIHWRGALNHDIVLGKIFFYIDWMLFPTNIPLISNKQTEPAGHEVYLSSPVFLFHFFFFFTSWIDNAIQNTPAVKATGYQNWVLSYNVLLSN